MSIEILVNVAPRETRAAILENGVVQEFHVERTSRRGLVSNLYKGRVSRVLPGMQAAFVEIGLERTAFLHAADIAASRSDDTLLGAPGAGLAQLEDIRRLLNAGDYHGAMLQFLNWDWGGGKVVAGLLRRREAETQEFGS